MRQFGIQISVSVFASIVALLLSWPYWRDFSYWPESRLAWWLYFAIGFVLSVYVFYVFLRAVRTLFEHDALEKTGAASASDNGGEGQP